VPGAHQQEQAREAVSVSRTAFGRALDSRVLCVPLVVPVRAPNAAPERRPPPALAAAQNGTSGALAYGKHARR